MGKTHDFHVNTALGISLDENVENIGKSLRTSDGQRARGPVRRRAFFRRLQGEPDYALGVHPRCLEAGCRWIVLCDTNGGTLPAEIWQITSAGHRVRHSRRSPGIHTHDDTGNAVAGSLAAVDAGARQIQGTLNGLGERCGNANLTTLIPTLLLKEPYASTL